MSEDNAMPTPKGTKVEIKGRNVYIPDWTMQQQINKAKYAMPLVSDPLANAAAVGQDEQDEGMYMAAVLHGVTKAIAQADLQETVPQLIEGVMVENDNGVPKMLTLKMAEEEFGWKFYDSIVPICAEVIRVNIGPLFEDGLQGMFGAM